MFNVFLSFDIWSCLSWICAPFFGFCCPLWILDKCDGYRYPGRDLFVDGQMGW